MIENPEMIRVAVAVLRCCTKADRTAAIVAAIEELPVDLVKIVDAALRTGKPGQSHSVQPIATSSVRESKGTRGGAVACP